MKLKAYRPSSTKYYVLRVSFKSEILSTEQLSNFNGLLDFLILSDDLCCLTYKELTYPVINVDEY